MIFYLYYYKKRQRFTVRYIPYGLYTILRAYVLFAQAIRNRNSVKGDGMKFFFQFRFFQLFEIDLKVCPFCNGNGINARKSICAYLKTKNQIIGKLRCKTCFSDFQLCYPTGFLSGGSYNFL